MSNRTSAQQVLPKSAFVSVLTKDLACTSSRFCSNYLGYFVSTGSDSAASAKAAAEGQALPT